MIPGLQYIPNFINDSTAEHLLEHIEHEPWMNSLARQVQHYGPIYDYPTRSLKPAIFDIPSWLKDILYDKVMAFKLFSKEPDQIIINEYMPGQGITKHVDAKVFGPTIASLSLLSNAPMKFGQNKEKTQSLLLEKNSIVVLTGDARSKWFHYVPKVQERRVSITLRTVL